MRKSAKFKKTTIVDIAKAGGVSVSTISRILNNKPDVSEETRQRVLKIIEDRKFTPQAPWQQLASGKSHLIVLHYPHGRGVFNQLALEFITGAATACEKANYSLNLIVSPLNETDLLAIYRSGQADGMILMETLIHDWRVELLRQHQIPFVMIGRCKNNTGLSFIDLDIETGIRAAVSHLVELDHRQIGFITIPPVSWQKEISYNTWAVRGYKKACKQYGLPVLWINIDSESGHIENVVPRFLDDHPQMRAIMTPHNVTAFMILRAVQAKGLRVPEDISFVGVVSDHEAQFTTPPLTTINFPTRMVGYEAGRMLIEQLKDSSRKAEQILVPHELIIRGSTAPVASKSRAE